MELSKIKSPADIRTMSIDELKELCDQLRKAFLIKISNHGGHVGPNLGLVEATVALHYVFNTPQDKIVYDVSHQTYIHKMLTGRMGAFLDPAKYDEVTGYTNPNESEYDLFTIGHTSTAVSLAGGIAKGRDLLGEKYNVVALVGDGSLSGGEAFEGLDEGATLNSNFIVVVNDNNMSIAENHGGLYDNLAKLRATDGRAEDNYFRTLGYDYIYVGDGNDVEALVEAFRKVKDTNHPVVVHIHTDKGHGYKPAEEHKEAFHYSGPFDLETGKPKSEDNSESYDDIFAQEMLAEMKADPKVCVLTAGTPGVLAFGPERRKEAGRQFIDVGIAEQEAAAMASGIAKAGGRPCFGVVSSFIQRAYDQLSQDISINKTPVVLNIFYGTVLGMTDVTHLGWFDIALISNIPGWVFLAPTNVEEYLSMQRWAMAQTEYPVAIRIPGGEVRHAEGSVQTDWSDLNKFSIERKGSEVAIIGAGTFLPLALQTADLLEKNGIKATVINPRYLSGLDSEMLEKLNNDHRLVITVEDGVLDGGFGEKVAHYYGTSDMKVANYGLTKKFADRYNYQQILTDNRLTAPQIAEDVLKLFK
ncbi:MAG: 1-deoxy-D-xylulose-5-phosphate synthase [Muribaculaceae bacterium]|nr:1-deoxy-D-xylulose-5-phosphate synthase [Bacteroides sp.]MDE6843657.1 1-deoxy-D-xylulose-5-phosphate synthase [Muribaculaceae bacterium]